MAKKQSKARALQTKAEVSPCFDSGREFGGTASSIGGTIISDKGGRLWVVDSQRGEGRPVRFFDK